MDTPYNLSEMDPNSFQHMANALAIKVLGAGLTTFGPGADGGRDGWFQGEANYPSPVDRWTGEWYIQSKYHKPNLTTNPNKWLIDQVKSEIREFTSSPLRQWPDNWIIVTNVGYSAAPKTGAFDVIRGLIRKENAALADKTHIWGESKVLEFLSTHPDVARRYGSFITPGNVLAALHESLSEGKAGVKEIIRYLVVTQFSDQQYTKLEQAGSSADNRPGIQKLFRDIPFVSTAWQSEQMAAQVLAKALAQNHTVDPTVDLSIWHKWQRNPSRARVWFIKGGPGQGKSTITQYFCQIQRAALILGDNTIRLAAKLRPVVSEVRDIASKDGLWPKQPRIPVALELKEYAKWIARQGEAPAPVIAYLAARIEEATAQKALAGTLKHIFATSRWLFVFDGMDEVPGDVKDLVAKEINYFVDDLLVDCGVDAHVICTSRPQGYSGQFDNLDAADVRLTSLNAEQALDCAKPILEIDRAPQDGARLCTILSDALSSQAIREIMTTPLQAHIMAVVVRDGGTPPERKWELFSNFYKVINKREAEKSADKKLAALLKGHGKLIKALHNRLGFELHSRAEASDGAQAALERGRLLEMIQETVVEFQTENAQETIATLKEATTDRLVLVNTPENSESVRFDIRPLQEFFAAEYIYETASYKTLANRVRAIASDSHWREVLHFLLSALIENERRGELSQVIQVLAEVDDPIEEELRPLARRLSLGAYAVARLLQEGVLEEDQRTRQAFKSCLLPLLATTDLWSEILSVDREHSKMWVLDVIKEVISDQVEPENVGAAAAALCLVDREFRQAAELRKLILGSTASYKACVFATILSTLRPDFEQKGLSSWGADVVLESLLCESWDEIGLSGIQDAYSLLGDHADRTGRMTHQLSEEARRIIAAMLQSYPYGKTKSKIVREMRFGLATVSLHEPSLELDANNWTEQTYQELQSLGGFVRVGANVAKAAAMGAAGSAWFQRNCEKDIRLLSFLPPRMRAFVTLQDEEGSEQRALPSQLIKTENQGLLESFSLDFSQGRESDWEGFGRKYPTVALHFVSRYRLRYGAPEIEQMIRDESVGKIILRALKERPMRALGISSSWGALVKGMPYIENELREVFMSAAAQCRVVERGYDEDFAPLTIRLPQEAALLPHLAVPIVQAALARRRDRHFLREERQQGYIDTASSQIKECRLDGGELMDIAKSDQYSHLVQAAAHVMALLIDVRRSELPTAQLASLAARYRSGVGSWFLSAVGLVANDAIEADRYDVKVEMSKVLQEARSDYSSRLLIDPLVERWREITRTPVLKSQPEIWR